MTGMVSDLDAMRPHVTITATDGNVHVIPVAFFNRVARGKRCITELDDFKTLVPVIIKEWMDGFEHE